MTLTWPVCLDWKPGRHHPVNNLPFQVGGRGLGSGVVLLRLIVLEDFNIHTETPMSPATQESMLVMATVGLSQTISGPTCMAGHLSRYLLQASMTDLGSIGLHCYVWSLKEFQLQIKFMRHKVVAL